MPFPNLYRIGSLQEQLDGSLKEVEHLKEARERQMKMVCFFLKYLLLPLCLSYLPTCTLYFSKRLACVFLQFYIVFELTIGRFSIVNATSQTKNLQSGVSVFC